MVETRVDFRIGAARTGTADDAEGKSLAVDL